MAIMAARRTIVDTDIIIDYLRRRERTLELALQQFECSITAISWYELNAVSRHSPRQQHLIARIPEILPVIPFDHRAADYAATIWRQLREIGQSVGISDTLIAGICLANGMPLLTKNVRHFSRIDGLEVISPEMLGI